MKIYLTSYQTQALPLEALNNFREDRVSAILRRKKRRYVAEKHIDYLSDIGEYWGKDLFAPIQPSTPEKLVVEVHKPRGSRGFESVLWRTSSFAVIRNPEDVIHSKLFNFGFWCDGVTATFSVAGNSLQRRDDLELFLKVIQYAFVQAAHNQPIHFNTRKKIGQAKRQHLYWLAAEGILPPAAEKLFMAVQANDMRCKQRAPRKILVDQWSQIVGLDRAIVSGSLSSAQL